MPKPNIIARSFLIGIPVFVSSYILIASNMSELIIKAGYMHAFPE